MPYEDQLLLAHETGTPIVCPLKSAGGLVVLYFTLQATREAADAAKHSVRIAFEQLQISERPWIGITAAVVSAPLVISGDKSQISITFRMKNSGTSIANRVRHTAMINFGTFNQASEAEASLCKFNPPNEGLAYLMLPGEDKPRTTQFTNSGGKIDVDEAGLTQMWLSGCIFYFDQLEKLHRTPFIYALVTNEGKGAFKPSGTFNGTLKEFSTATAAD